MINAPASNELIDSRYAAWRLLSTLCLVTLGSSCMYVVSVVLPAVQAEFGTSRADASLPYTMMMICLGIGGVWTGKLADRFGISPVLWMGSAAVLAGFVVAALAPNIWVFGLAHGLLLGLLGSSATFAPLMADTSLWWNKRRGIAVAICASGNYVAGAVWPPLAQLGIETIGWRYTYIAMGVCCGLGMALLSFAMRQRPPLVNQTSASAHSIAKPISFPSTHPFGLQLGHAQILLCVAGFACCVAMSMPQVHIVAYCGDLGYGAARGAQMLSLMLTCGIVSRLLSGGIWDRIGGVSTLLLGSALQANITLQANAEDYALLSSLGEDLKFVFITSAMALTQGEALATQVRVSPDAKCERCWHYRDDVGLDAAHPALCGRCTSNLYGAGEVRHFA